MKKVLAIVYSGFPMDPRPRREADAMIEKDCDVDMICLNNGGQAAREKRFGVHVYRVDIKRRRDSKLRYIWQYFAFLCVSFWMAAKMHIKNEYDVIHVHNMPDFLVFSALIPKIMKAKVVLDLHDPMPEIYRTKYHLEENHPVIKLLICIEKLSIKFADVVITPNKAFKEIFVARGCPEKKIHIVMNSPMEKIFLDQKLETPPETAVSESAFRIMFHGFIAEHNGLDLALEAVADLRQEIPELKLNIFGGGSYVEHLQGQVESLDLSDNVTINGTVSQSLIAENIIACDLGIIPNLRTAFTEINFPTRIFEYLCLKKPVIAPRTRGVLDYFDDDSIYFFDPGNKQSLKEAIALVYKDKVATRQVVEKGYQVYKNYTWEQQKETLLSVVM